MKKFILLVALATALPTAAQTLEYAWLSQPCGIMLNCDSGYSGGCSACAEPVESSTLFQGTALVWYGVDVCPYPVSVGDNAVVTYGWPTFADTGHFILLSGIAFVPVQIDSIIIRHSSATDGPGRFLVRFGINENLPTTVIGDEVTDGTSTSTVFTNLGCAEAVNGMIYGFFQLMLQPYDGGQGGWALDDIRVVGSDCLSTSVNDLVSPTSRGPDLPAFDLLGRPVPRVAAQGMYITTDGRRVIVVN